MSPKILVTAVLIAVVTTQALAFKDYETASLKAHNKYRALHKNTPPMKLDNELNKLAQKCAQYYANKGENDHSCPYKKKAGENLGWSKSSKGYESKVAAAVDAVKRFYNEIRDYDYNKPVFHKKTGHFTQVVWAESTRLGVGVAQKNGETYVCNLYLKGGNMKGDFQKNVSKPR